MRPLTDHTAKPLLKAGGQSLIEYHLAALSRAGVNRVVINTCWQAEKIVEQLGTGARYGLEIIYSHESDALETAGGIVNAIELLGEQPFLLISADIWGNFEFESLTLKAPDLGHLLLVQNPPHHPDGDFYLDQTRIALHAGQRFTYSGVGLFHPSVFKDLSPGFRPLREVLKNLIDRRLLAGSLHRAPWFDIGTPMRLAELDDFLISADTVGVHTLKTD